MKQNPTIYKIDDAFTYSKVIKGVKDHLTTNEKNYKERDIVLGNFDGQLIVIEPDDKPSEWKKLFPLLAPT